MREARHPQRTSRARLTAAALTVLALTATATACGDSGSSGGSDSEGSGKGTITFWDNNGGPQRTPVWKTIIQKFEKKYPDIKVEYVPIPSTSVQQKYDTAVAGGGLPDVGLVGTAYLADLTAQNALEPLDSRIKGSSIDGQLLKGFVETVRQSGNSDKLYAVPTSGNMGTLWYRTDLFKAANLQPPTTWDAFYTAAETLTNKAKDEFGFTIRGGAGSIAQALEVIYAQSGIDTFWKNDKTTVNDPKNVAALDKLAALYNTATPKADLNNDYVKMVAEFDNGSIGMLQHNLGSYQDHVKSLGLDKVAGVPLPPAKPGAARTIVSEPVDGIGLFKSSKNKAAAWKFIEFATSHEMNTYWNEQAGQVPANTLAVDDDWIQEAPATRDAFKAMDDPNTKIIQLPYYLPEWNSLSKATSEPDFQKVLLKKMTSKEFLDKLADQLNTAQSEWRQRQKG